MAQDKKVAIVVDYLIEHGGAEKTLEAIIELFPNAPIYTGLYNPQKMSASINKQKIIASQNSLLTRFSKYCTFLMPLVFENFDLREYDIVISAGHAWAKGVLTTPDQLHITYCHSPPRFLYGYSVATAKRNAWYFRPFVAVVDYILRMWDYTAAQRPDYIVCNSIEVQKRIKKFYGRNATVLYPPVDLAKNGAGSSGDYYLALGRLAAFKNFDFLITAFTKMPDKKLIIAGGGAEEQRLRALAGSNITLKGRVSEQEKAELLANCKGVINSVDDEDLGIVPIEAMSYGKPVLGHKSGGHLETIENWVTGMFFESFEVTEFVKTVEDFEKLIDNGEFDALKIRTSTEKFAKEKFKTAFAKFVNNPHLG